MSFADESEHERDTDPAPRELEPYKIEVPDEIARRIDGAVELVSKRLGKTKDARRTVELALLRRGIEWVLQDEGWR